MKAIKLSIIFATFVIVGCATITPPPPFSDNTGGIGGSNSLGGDPAPNLALQTLNTIPDSIISMVNNMATPPKTAFIRYGNVTTAHYLSDTSGTSPAFEAAYQTLPPKFQQLAHVPADANREYVQLATSVDKKILAYQVNGTTRQFALMDNVGDLYRFASVEQRAGGFYLTREFDDLYINPTALLNPNTYYIVIGFQNVPSAGTTNDIGGLGVGIK